MQTIGTEELKMMRGRNHGLTVINVLGEESHRKAHIPGTENVPRDADDFVQRVERLSGGKERPVVVYCASTDCDASPKAAKTLEQAGFEHVYDFEGGMKAWREAGEPVAPSS